MINFFKKLFNLTPSDLQPDIKVAVLISYKYDKDYLQDCIDNVAELADIWVIKEDVYGDLLKDEGQYRKSMIEEAVSQGANWAIIIDPDERFEKNAIAFIKNFIIDNHHQEKKKMLQFDFLELYEPNRYRTDGIWQDKKRVVVFPLCPDNVFSDAKLHTPKNPLNADYEVVDTRLRLYHLKHINPRLRQHRRDLYQTLDPNWQYQTIGYDYLVDEQTMQLTYIEGDRAYYPAYREYVMDEAYFELLENLRQE